MYKILNNKHFSSSDLSDLLEETLVGKKIVELSDDRILLENCYELLIEPNRGCGGCDNGWASLELSSYNINLDAAVMNVKIEEPDVFDNSDLFKIFIYLADSSIITFEGDDGFGNGMYGYGFWVTTRFKE